MSLIPFDDFFFPTSRPHYYRSNHPLTHYHYSPLNNDGIFASVLNDTYSQLQQMERQLGQCQKEEFGKSDSKKNYAFRCSVAGYHPEELTVDVEGDELVIQGKHQQQADGQSIHRTFERRVTLPESIEKETIQCNLDEKGCLEVRAERKMKELDKDNKKNIPIGFKSSEAKENQLTNGTASDAK